MSTGQIFKSPIRQPSDKTRAPPYSPFVDYTPRRAALTHDPANTNSISYARERRSQFLHQMAVEEDNLSNEEQYMESPSVKSFLGFTPQRVVSSFDEKLKQAADLDLLANKKEWTAKDFELVHHLGTGKFGVVFKAIEIRSQKTCAIKIMIKKELQDAGVVPFLKREVEIQAHLNHPNIVRLYGYFHDQDHIYLVQEFAGENDLHTVLGHYQRFTEQEAAHYILEIAEGLKYMHSLGVFHRDIKLENVMVSQKGTLKLADFGWAVYDPKPRRNTFCGTLDYLPPEMIQSRPHDQAVDVWAMGIICFELLTGKPPFDLNPELKNIEENYDVILKSQVEYPDYLSQGAKKFISKLLCKSPSLRLSITAIQDDPWLKSFM